MHDDNNSDSNNFSNSSSSVDFEGLDNEPLDLKSYFEEIIVAISSSINSRFQEIEERIESFEKQIATLVVGFGEQAVFLEALLAQLSFASEEQQKAFHQNVNQARKDMLKVMQDGSKTIVAQQDEDLASAIDDVVESKLSDS